MNIKDLILKEESEDAAKCAVSVLYLIRETIKTLPLPEYPSYVPTEYAEGHNAGAQAMREAALELLK